MSIKESATRTISPMYTSKVVKVHDVIFVNKE